MIRKFTYTLILFSLPLFLLSAQVYTDYLGAGHDQDIGITSSSFENNLTGSKTISGEGLDNPKMEAARFLAQTTLGFDMALIESLENTDFESWIDTQIALPASNMLTTMKTVWAEVLALHAANGEPAEEVFGPYQLHFNYAWWTLT